MSTVPDPSPKIQASPDSDPNSDPNATPTPHLSPRARRARRAARTWRTWRTVPRGVPLRWAAGRPRGRDVPRLPRPIGSGGNCDPLGGDRVTLTSRDAEWLAAMRPWALLLVVRFSVRPQDIDDVVQEAFAIAAIHWATFLPPHTEPDEVARRRWLARILFNTAARHRQRLHRRRRREIEWSDALEASLPPRPARDPAADRELLDKLQHATTASRWRTWRAYEIDGVPVEEIARQEGRSIPGIYHRLEHARRDLATALRRDAAIGNGPMVRRTPSKRRR